MKVEKVYTEEEKNKLIEKAKHKIYCPLFEAMQDYVDCRIASGLRDFCEKNFAIATLLEKKESHCILQEVE